MDAQAAWNLGELPTVSSIEEELKDHRGVIWGKSSEVNTVIV